MDMKMMTKSVELQVDPKVVFEVLRQKLRVPPEASVIEEPTAFQTKNINRIQLANILFVKWH